MTQPSKTIQALNYVYYSFKLSNDPVDTLWSYFAMPIINVDVQEHALSNQLEGVALINSLSLLHSELTDNLKEVLDSYIQTALTRKEV